MILNNHILEVKDEAKVKLLKYILAVLMLGLIVMNTFFAFKILQFSSDSNKVVQSSQNNIVPNNTDSKFITFDGNLLAQVKERAKSDKSFAASLQALKAQADRLLNIEPFSVVHKKVVPPSGDIHDYISLQPYWWKMPSEKYEQRDGQDNTERHETYTDEKQIMIMAEDSFTLALAYYFFRDERFADKAATIIHTWFLDEKTRMNPNFNFAQVIPGETKGNGGAMDGRLLPLIMDASMLIEKTNTLTSKDQSALKQWFSELLIWLTIDRTQLDEAKYPNNHGTWYDALVASVSYFTGDIKRTRDIVEGSKLKRIKVQIEPDGQQSLETTRSKSFSYSGFNLLGLFRLANIGQNINIDLWNYQTEDGRSIRKALDYLLPYLNKERKWPFTHKALEMTEPLFTDIFHQATCAYGDIRYMQIAKLLVENDLSNIRNFLYPYQTCSPV